jgi:hypothetical protein
VYRYEGGNPAFLRTIIDQYDAIGRPQTQTQSFYSHSGGVWQDYTSTMSYDLAGNPTSEGYPSSRSVATTYSLSGRISGLSTNSTTLLSDMSYEACGGLASEKYAAGNNLIHAMSYNNRLQPSEIKLGTSGTSDSIFKLMAIHSVEPNDRVHYVSYAVRDYAFAAADALCLVNESKVIRKITPVNSRNSSIRTDFRDYEIAIATTQEFTNAYGNGTLADARAAIKSVLTQLQMIYDRELSMSGNPISFTNANADVMVNEVRSVLVADMSGYFAP